ncbi:MAG: four helix bundle protein [Candidatus Omnitrophota bacterium]
MVERDFQFDFERLKVYQFSLEFIDKVFEIYKNHPVEYKYPLGSNLLRAGLSIANNLAEGSDKKSSKERARYYGTSSDSTRECISVFNVLKRQRLIKDDFYYQLRVNGREITSMIRGLIATL